MAPPPEYDKEPKAPDKSATIISTEDSKLLNNLLNDQHTYSDHKPTNTVAAVEVENNKHVETLDDGQLRALLDEAITYKCPKDREGKSSLFKELLEEVEQDEQACEEAARTLSGCRGARRGGRGRRALPHSNSLQDLVAALAAEPAPRRHHVRHHPPTPAPSNVSARAIHGGSLPSGVDTSSLLSEEPVRGAGYLATVRCVNPPPLAERRVSASDANTPAETELLNRRSKPTFPMTYTARATLEIGSGSVCSGRAVTTTTASNQVRTPSPRARELHIDLPNTVVHLSQNKLMNALRPKTEIDEGGGIDGQPLVKYETIGMFSLDKNEPRGPIDPKRHVSENQEYQRSQQSIQNNESSTANTKGSLYDLQLANNVDNWYKSLATYHDPLCSAPNPNKKDEKIHPVVATKIDYNNIKSTSMENNAINHYSIENADYYSPNISLKDYTKYNAVPFLPKREIIKESIGNESQSDPRHYDEGKHRVIENVKHKFTDCDTSLRAKYRKQVGENLVVPTLSEINPRNIRCMTIGQPQLDKLKDVHCTDTIYKKSQKHVSEENTANISSDDVEVESNPVYFNNMDNKFNEIGVDEDTAKLSQISDTASNLLSDEQEFIGWCTNPLVDVENDHSRINDIELTDVRCSHSHKDLSFSQYVSKQQRLLESLGNCENNTGTTIADDYQKEKYHPFSNKPENIMENLNDFTEKIAVKDDPNSVCLNESKIVTPSNKPDDEDATNRNRLLLAQLPNNAYVFLTFPKPLLSSPNNNHVIITPNPLHELEKNDDVKLLVCESNNEPNIVKKTKEKTPLRQPVRSDKKKTMLDKNILKVLLFESLFKENVNENLSGYPAVSASTDKEVDSAISFSCITTPEVVSSCNTTSSTAQSAVAVDPKPRSVISSSFNGLPLSRPNYGSTATSASDEYKKSLDENGNSVQGFSSPLSGSSQHKKPRRKKSSKNETVIDCQQIDGYQGDKDVNELLRFIESNADNGRGAKLGRVKHKDDSDDKSGKKRSTERRKDKESKMKRATSMEELSRTKIEDLTDAEAPLRTDKKERRGDAAPNKAERRSWGDDALYDVTPDTTSSVAAELTDFQTVTKKRKPRRRADEHEREPPRRARAPSPRPRRESAPPSDRSNDSNDDMDSVHSLPAAPPPAPPAPHASYADIARTRHNIPDLIESCNFYAEGEAAPPAADTYPALEVRAARRRDGKPAPAGARRERKERPAPPGDDAADCPAPDVVADRRPPVILLDSAARPRDMDGVTFGFDINEQLLSGGGRRPRCDLLRDAPEAGVPVRAGCAALRYVPPEPPPDAAHLLHIVDYVGNAWEDVLRCGAGKLRYFSE